MSSLLLGSSELQILMTLSNLLTTVIVPPDPLSCGVRHDRGVCLREDAPPAEQYPGYTARLNNTQLAWQGEFPWLAPVRGAPPSRLESPLPVCGGVLVHPQAVLVSAACHEEATSADLRMSVRLAEYDINREVDSGRPPLDVAIRRAVYHSGYRRAGVAVINDLGLLILERPVVLTEEVNVICLPQWDDALDGPTGLAADWEGTECVLHGWVDTTSDTTPIPLRERVRFLPRDECQTRLRELRRLGPLHTLHESFACGTAETNCWADGGSVLACRLRQDRSRWVLAGIRPWTREFNDCNQVATYTNVGLFAGWIRDTITAELSAFA